MFSAASHSTSAVTRCVPKAHAGADAGFDTAVTAAAEEKKSSADVRARRAKTLARLRADIQSIEDRGAGRIASGRLLDVPQSSVSHETSARWCLGEDGIDGRLGPHGLDVCGLHEIKPALGTATDQDAGISSGGDALAGRVASALSFAWRLAARRLLVGVGGGEVGAGGSAHGPPVVWCTHAAMSFEYGALYGPGLAPLGWHHAQLVLVRTKRPDETLWAMEEALRSGAAGAVIAHVDAVDPTPARRLALAAQEGGTLCLVVSAPRSPVMPATATRWRVGSAPPDRWRDRGSSFVTAPKPLFEVRLERCRRHVSAGPLAPRILEWSDETLSFRLVSALADGAACPRPALAG